MPLHSKELCTTKKAIIGSIVVFVFSVLLNISRWIEASDSDLRLNAPKFYEAPSYGGYFLNFSHDSHGTGLLRYRYYLLLFHGVAWNLIMYVIPIGLLTFFNAKIWRQVRASYKCVVSASV